MFRTICIAIFVLSTQWIYSQSSSPTDQELDKFSEVFIQQKVDLQKFENQTISFLAETGVSHARYGEILRAQFTGTVLEFSDAETKAMDKLKALKQNFTSDRQRAMIALCSQSQISLERYNEINEMQRKDHAVMQRLQPILSKKAKQQ